MADTSLLLDIYLKEYDKLKSEQADRIGFRDNLLYVTIGVISGILSFAFSAPADSIALLIVPWAMLILGWTYLVNDDKISAIGKYIRFTLVDNIKPMLGEAKLEALLGWRSPIAAISGAAAARSKQSIIDEITFILPGLVAMLLYWLLTPAPPTAATVATLIEVPLLVFLGTEIVIYAEPAKGR